MTTPPWGHKPLPVDAPERYWGYPPPVPSERCEYWLRRYEEGSWAPNKHLRRHTYYGATTWLGIYIWEYWHVFRPLETRYKQEVLGHR